MAQFNHFELSLLNPSFDSPLVDALTELEILRHLQLETDVHPILFAQLKAIFHMLESLGSARIEGNHTTLADYVESKVEGTQSSTDQLKEINNIEAAMEFIDEYLSNGDDITEYFIRELHSLVVAELQQEGDRTPGAYRQHNVSIAQSDHLPPDHIHVPDYMAELTDFINREDKPKYDLMKIALVHHRFGWIHPFGNGNGRTVRLLTYALLIKYGFNVQTGGRVLNPTAVFCNDRERYYAMLSLADKGTEQGLEEWCLYVLSGISSELKKVDQLTNHAFLSKKILYPAIDFSLERGLINLLESKVLKRSVELGTIKAGDLRAVLPDLKPTQMTYQLGKLIERGLLRPVEEGARIYTAKFSNSYLIRGVIKVLREEGFIPNL
ncbi:MULTISPECIES: Fic family protein [Providencia]|uniref:Fic family protein n=1 Tax=Providencia TaxID=586 RepID=UPI0003E1F18E|nr:MULTISPECIES: Fic family protein [Providencia]ETS99365.1 Fic/DOC family protein [Providencia alcalifaciens PAL-3]EUC99843.1 Fic/DOC family protein [Providencia alcalifaciens PAL-1]MTB47380.1 Fic family protein [Providencia sp. wls1950]MTC42701.1 Fic family protein [Providencia sp. wls1921]MTC47171.1 Fic family protein [Providencia sp. wls1922]